MPRSMPRRSTRETRSPDYYRSLHNVKRPVVGSTVIYNGQCRFLKTDRKPRALVIAVYANDYYQVKLLTNNAELFCDLTELVPIDGDYWHYRRLLCP